MTLLESLILELGAEVPLTIHIMVLLSSFCQWGSMYVCRRCGGCRRCIDVPSPLPMVRPQAAAFIMETKKAQRKCWTLHDTASGIKVLSTLSKMAIELSLKSCNTASGIKVLSTARLRRLDIPGHSTLFLKTFAIFGQNPAWPKIFCFENP